MESTSFGSALAVSYKVLRVLKRGAGTETLLALDRRTGVEVIVKVVDLELMSSDARQFLRHEGWLLKGLSRSGIASVINTVDDGDRLYVIMPFVAGVTLRRRLRIAPLDVPDSLTVARHILGALVRIHAHGAFHRDIRPTNVMVDEGRPLRTVTLVDFGLASKEFLTLDSVGEPSLGSRYMAPELAGVLDRPVDGRADLYSTGIVLFECLAGRPPFDAVDIRQILRDQLSTAPPRLRNLGVAVPQALEEILGRLLRKDPDDRYHSAAAALADVEELDCALRSGVTEPDVAVGSQDRRHSLTEPALTGREGELRFLRRRLTDASRGIAGTVVLESSSGGGKTRLLDEFCQRAITTGARVLRARGLEWSEQRPLQLLAAFMEDLLRHATMDPTFARDLVGRLGDAIDPLCAELPEMREVLVDIGGARPGVGNAIGRGAGEAFTRNRLVSALTTLLDSLGSAHRTAVVAVDDCQWADELTLEVLGAWAERCANRAHTARCVLVVVALRSEDSGPYRQLTSRDPGPERLTLPPLDAGEIGQVVESMAGKVPPDAVNVVVELSRGNPLMVSAVLRGLVEIDALSPGASGWHLKQVPGGWQASREAAAFLARRFAALTPATRQLIDAGAVLGRKFDLPLAAALVGQDDTRAGDAIEQAIERHLVWANRSGTFIFAHDRLRDSLLGELEPSRLTELHRLAAEKIEEIDPGRAFDLAYHFDAAGEPARGLNHALQSAEEARAGHDFELAERQYRIAERGMTDAPTETQYRVVERLGQILTLRGRYDEATARFERARTLARNSLEIAWIEGQLGELLFRRDDLEGAAALLESGLRELGERIPEGGPIRLVSRLVWEVVGRYARKTLRVSSPTRSEADQDLDRMKAHLYTRLLYPRWFHARRLQNFCLMMRQINVSERCPEGVELAHAYSIWGAGLALTFPFSWRHGMRYIDLGELIYQRHGDRRGVGHMASMRTCILHATGRYREAIDSADGAIRILAEFGDRWELGFAARNRAVCLYRLGRFREAGDEARRVIDIGLEVGDANAQITALEVLAKATGGQVSGVQTRVGLGHQGNDLEVSVAALQAEALRLRKAGQLTRAIEHLERAVALVRRAQPTSTHLVPVFAWLATLRREYAEKSFIPHIRRKRLRQARASAQRAVRYARLYPNDRPHALRELGVVSALAGRRRRARRYLDRSAQCARRREAWAELNETDLQRERLEFDQVGRTQERAAELGSIVERIGPPTLGLAARITTLLEAGVLLTSTDTPDGTVRAIQQIVESLLRAETCRVVGMTPDWRSESVDASTREAAAVQTSVSQRGPVVINEPGDVINESAAGVPRSALCVPVFVSGELAGYFLALHSQVDELFGQEEQQLAEFVARLAGAALKRQQLERDSRGRAIAAQETERARVARDLHDEIGQALTSVLLGVRLVESSVSGHETWSGGPGDVLERTAELRKAAASALDSVQRLAFDLRPAVLDDLGLIAAVRRLTASAVTGDVVVELETVNLGPGERLSPEIEITAYRVAQEAVTNVVRHARATRCSVVIGRVQGRLRVVIEDNGTGFSPEDRRRDGLGILGMNERATLVGGVLRVDSTPGKGTSVVLEVQLEH